MTQPRSIIPATLIESWLPIEALSVESIRERASMTALPPTYYLHVWWARRPLITSRAAVLASLLPSWRDDWPATLQAKFPTEESYRAWFMRLLGIFGDPVESRKLADYANARNIKLKSNPYNYDRPFKINPVEDDLTTMLDLLEQTWGSRELTVMDPMAGGGSIPFEALRYGFTTLANELNPVPSVILKATLDYPARFGPALTKEIRKWGNEWAKRVEQRLADYFPKQPGENIQAYIWARTVACPTTGKPVPLSPNWWISKGSDPVAVRLRTDPAWNAPHFEIVSGDAIDFDPDEGTVSRGVGRSPWTGEAIDGDYIKREAQAGRMGQMLYAIALKQRGGFDFRAPTADDLAAMARAESDLAANVPRWEAAGLVPVEAIPEGLKTDEPRRYGIYRWADAFSPRQLLSLITYIETLAEIDEELHQKGQGADAIATYLSFALTKCTNYNSRMSIWHALRTTVANTFNRHDFAFAWSHAEFDASANLLPWTMGQVTKAYKELAELTTSAQLPLWSTAAAQAPVDRLTITQGSATNLAATPAGSVHAIVVDPPYYDNVMYAELSDFFYVWLKRSVGHLYSDFFRDELTNKDDEAVANPARFAAFGSKKKQLAKQDYERKMAAAFREMNRVLRADGVLTVMFTHKQVEAWDTLATALIGAGFVIKASWPVHTESEHSLHQAKKNAAASTILLVCRKRVGESQKSLAPDPQPLTPVWWDDIKGRVRAVARQKATEFAAQGIGGVDLYISTFGPVLAVISAQWPVLTSEVDEKTGQPKPLRPETALDLAREEVVSLRKQGLLLGRDIQFDPITDWYLMAWADYQAEQFPADEARKLALVLDLNIEKDLVQRKRVISKKGSYVLLQTPAQRRRKGLADPEADSFESWLDAAHALMLIYQADGAQAAAAFLKRTGLRNDGTFKAVLQALLNAIPRTQVKGKFVRPEAAVLENLRLSFFEELAVPVEEEPAGAEVRQLGMFEE